MALYPFTIGDLTFNLIDFDQFAYPTGMLNSVEAAMKHVTKFASGTSSNAVAIGTGAKTFNGLASKAFQIGDYLLAFSSAGNWMTGAVTAYNALTGALTINSDRTSGAGTTTMSVVKIGESSLTQLAQPLEPVFGGKGAAANFSGNRALTPGMQWGSSLGNEAASIWDSMAQQYDDFVCFDTPSTISANGGQPVKNLSSPYFSNNVLFNNTGATVKVSGNMHGFVEMQVNNKQFGGCVFCHGQNGYVLASGGVLHFETVVRFSGPNYVGYTPTNTRIGLRGQGSGSSSNIFSYSGIGFELLSSNNGRFNTFVGNSGQVSRTVVPVSVVTGDSTYRFTVICSADGNRVRFLINGTLVLDSICALPSDRIENMMHPAWEIQHSSAYRSGDIASTLFIDAFILRKNLTR